MKYDEAEDRIDFLLLQILKFLNGAKKNGISHKQWEHVLALFSSPWAGGS